MATANVVNVVSLLKIFALNNKQTHSRITKFPIFRVKKNLLKIVKNDIFYLFFVYEFKHPFDYSLPIFVSNWNILFHYESDFVGDFPNKYTRFCFEFGEYYDHVTFPTIDLEEFEHLFYMRDRDRRCQSKKRNRKSF